MMVIVEKAGLDPIRSRIRAAAQKVVANSPAIHATNPNQANQNLALKEPRCGPSSSGVWSSEISWWE